MSAEYKNKESPTANELNNEEFTDFAFETHYYAYWDAGYSNITKGDFLHLGLTISPKDYLSLDPWKDFASLEEAEKISRMPEHQQKATLKKYCAIMIGLNVEALPLCEKNL